MALHMILELVKLELFEYGIVCDDFDARLTVFACALEVTILN